MAIVKINLLSRTLNHKDEILIYLPTDTFADKRAGISYEVPGMKYQTLWLLHGGGGDNSDFHDFSNSLYYAEQNRVALIMPSGVCFHQDPYFTYVTEELPKRLRLLFPLSDKPEDNFIGGLSYGGDCAMRAAMEFPDRYAAALIMSAAGTDHHGACELRFDVFGLAQRNLAENRPLPKLIFGTGSGDSGFPLYEPIINRLEAMGIPVQKHFVDGDGHSWPFWDATIKMAMENGFGLKHAVILPEQGEEA